MVEMRIILVLAFAFMITGCDTISGTSRTAAIQSMPDVNAIAEHIRKYPEIDKVEIKEDVGGIPFTLTGLKRPDQIYNIFYSGGLCVHGTIQLTVNYKNEIEYRQYLGMMNRRCPPEWLAATVPVMEKIERDLENIFRIENLSKKVRINYFRANPPVQNK